MFNSIPKESLKDIMHTFLFAIDGHDNVTGSYEEPTLTCALSIYFCHLLCQIEIYRYISKGIYDFETGHRVK